MTLFRQSLFRFSLLTVILGFFVACEATREDKVTEQPTHQPAVLTLSEKGFKTFISGEFVNVDELFSTQLNQLNGKDYFSYYDLQTHSLYLHEYQSGTLVKRVQLKKEGPDKVITFINPQFYIYSLDSIYINTNFSGYYLIDSNGKVLSDANKRSSGFRGDEMNIQFNESSFLTSSGVNGAIRWKGKKIVEHFPFVWGSLNFDTGELTTSPIHASVIFEDYEAILEFWRQARKKNKLHALFQLQSMQHADELLLTTNITDSISIFKDNQLIKRIYAGIPDHPVVDYLTYLQNGEIIMGKGVVRSKTVLNKPGFYENTLLGPNGRFIYRILVHGTKPGISPYDGSEMPVIKGASLLVIDRETDKHYHHELPEDEIYLWGSFLARAFVNTDGIHFRVKDQDNEDEIQYRVFGIDIQK